MSIANEISGLLENAKRDNDLRLIDQQLNDFIAEFIQVLLKLRRLKVSRRYIALFNCFR